MRAVGTVFRRELLEKRYLLLGAAAISILPFFPRLLPFVSASPDEARVTTALAIAGGFGVFTAIFAGVSAFSTELSQRRLGFYLSAPIGAWELWAGKVLAAIALLAAVFSVVLLPTFLANPHSLVDALDELRVIPKLPIALALLLAAAYIGVALRSRSLWIVVDFTAAAVFTWLFLWISRQPEFLVRDGKTHTIPYLALLAGTGALVSVALALLAGVAFGRADMKRWHAGSAMVLWSSLAVTAGLLILSLTWIRSAGIHDLRDIWFTGATSNRSTWAVVTGRASWRGDFQHAFVYNVRTGENRRVGSPGAAISADGSRIAWIEPSTDNTAADLVVERIDGSSRLRIEMPAGRNLVNRLVLSDDGSRIAVADPEQITVYDCEHGTMLAAGTDQCRVVQVTVWTHAYRKRSPRRAMPFQRQRTVRFGANGRRWKSQR